MANEHAKYYQVKENERLISSRYIFIRKISHYRVSTVDFSRSSYLPHLSAVRLVWLRGIQDYISRSSEWNSRIPRRLTFCCYHWGRLPLAVHWIIGDLDQLKKYRNELHRYIGIYYWAERSYCSASLSRLFAQIPDLHGKHLAITQVEFFNAGFMQDFSYCFVAGGNVGISTQIQRMQLKHIVWCSDILRCYKPLSCCNNNIYRRQSNLINFGASSQN